MSSFTATASDDVCPDDVALTSDLDLIVELSDQAAQGAIGTYLVEDWRRSPLRRTLDAAVGRMISAKRKVPVSVTEALERMEAARRPLA